MITHDVKSLSDEPLIRFLDYFLPGHSLSLLTLILYSLPKQVFFQLKTTQLSSLDPTLTEQNFLSSLIDSTLHEHVTHSSKYDLLQEELSVLRFHMGIQSEYCHISNYQAGVNDAEHRFFRCQGLKKWHNS